VVSVRTVFKGKAARTAPCRRATIEQYVPICQKNNLLLFLDLNIGWATRSLN